MPLVPAKKEERTAFYRSKIAPWTTNAVAIGTTSGAVTALDALVTAAQAAIDAQTAALAAYRTAVEATNAKVEAMSVAGANIISAIRTKGRTGGQTVYDLAQIPGPATPTPVGPPGTPSDFSTVLQPTGAVEFSWKCSNPAGSVGTIYQIYRQNQSTGAFEYLGGSGVRKFVDFSLPAGTAQVTYQIQATRSTAVGMANEFTVKFGTSSSGAMTATVVESGPKPAKVAA